MTKTRKMTTPIHYDPVPEIKLLEMMNNPL